MKSIRKYARKHFESLVNHLSHYEKTPEPETLHDLRVDIKKLRAPFHLANASVKDFRMHTIFRPLRLVFKTAGAIRLADINKGIEMSTGKQSTDLSLTRRRNAFRKATPDRIVAIRKLDKKLRRDFQKIKKKDLRYYLKKTKAEARDLLYPRFKQDDLHLARKKIKDILYLSTIRNHKKPDPFYDKVQDTIGKWHDKQTVLASLHRPKDKEKIDKLKAESREDVLAIKRLVVGYYGQTDKRQVHSKGS